MNSTAVVFVAVPIVVTIACFIVPRWLSGLIVSLDLIWVVFLLAVLSGCNPEGQRVWEQDPNCLWLILASAAPLLFEVYWRIRKHNAGEQAAGGYVRFASEPQP